MAKSNYYPEVAISYPKNPDKLWAIPVVGILLKLLLLIPVFIEIIVLSWAAVILSWVNSFIVLVNGEYMPASYNLNIGLFRLVAKMSFYLAGVTDKYPGFNLETEGDLKVNMPMPKAPNRLYAIPIFGGLFRVIVIIPYAIFAGLLRNAVSIGMIGSWVPVLSSDRYPESIYELSVDANRVNFACYAWALGMSDKYPSFEMNWDHKNIKIFLIILAIFPTFGGYMGGSHEQKRQLEQYQNIDYSSLKDLPSQYR